MNRPTGEPARIAIWLTPAGTAALACLRLAGPGTAACVGRRFSKPLAAGRCVHGELSDDSGVIDDPVVVQIDDSTVDLTFHAGQAIIESVNALFEREGFKLVDDLSQHPDDLKSLVHARTTLEAEMLSALPRARTELAVRTLANQPKAWETWASGYRPENAGEIDAMIKDITLRRLLEPASVALVGLPNAGKSTLANQLFGQKRSIVADVPGTTRDWVGHEANLDGVIVKLIDTPGRRDTADAIESAAIESSRPVVGRADVVVIVADGSRSPADHESLFMDHPKALIALNKSDLAVDAWLDYPARFVPVVATIGEGVQTLVASIREELGFGGFDPSCARVWTKRQIELLLAIRAGELPASAMLD